ncbi:LytR/AlgR family response regulator transcription factor [Spongiimicrobium salis]|uniref:LytR/AlgR family response regulator transcription factor n=1 Tax=Spongiimicrobium salis TaxID=1667022 RepID=UPI00374D720B
MISYLIADDEPIAHRIIEGYAQDLPQLKKVANCYDAFETIRQLQQHTVDLVFLDINMPKLTGFELLKTLSHPPKVIVTSAYKEFALEGYELNIVDYLLKPFSFERFMTAVNKISLHHAIPTVPESQQQKEERLSIKGDKKHYLIAFDDILFVEAYGNYCKVFTIEEVITTLQKISTFETRLPQNFIRIHKSFIVAKNKVKAIEGNTIHLKKHSLPIGQTYRSAIKIIFNTFNS